MSHGSRGEAFEKAQHERPDFVSEEHLEFLDELRKSGKTNMFGARTYIEEAFEELDEDEAAAVLGYWMKTFSERHPKEV